MTKSELKTGMIVTRRDGKKLTVYRNCVCLACYSKNNDVIVDALNDNWDLLDYYTEDLTHKDFHKFDIIKVELVCHPYDYNKHTSYAKISKTLWERNDTKKLTIAEIESILGYNVEIISEKENV